MTSNAPSLLGARAMHVLVPLCDSHGDHGSSSESTPRSSPGTDVSAKETVADGVAVDRRRKNPSQQRSVNNSRDRMKQEMHHLRGTVEELKRQLDEIKRDHMRRSPRPNSALTPHAAQLIAAWESLARGQCEQRYRAEVENVKLRKMLDDQVKIAQTLERVLTKRRCVEQLFDSEKYIKRTRTSPHESTPHEVVLAEMSALLPSLYMQVDTVLAKDCFSKGVGESIRHVDVRHADAAGTYVEATEKRVVPFSIEDAGTALWENLVFYPDLRSADDDANREVELSQNVIVRETELCLKLSRFTGPMRVKFTARRYVEADRSVIVWVAVADPSEIQEMQLNGVHMRHTGWICARTAPVGTTTSAMAECLWAHLAVPEFVDGHTGGGDHKRRMYTLTNFIVSWIHSQMDTSNHMLDNRLLERSLARAVKT